MRDYDELGETQARQPQPADAPIGGSTGLRSPEGWDVESLHVREGGGWDDLAFRPVASYAQHHWRALLSQCSRFCTTGICKLHWGFHADNPKKIRADLEEYVQTLGVEEAALALLNMFDVREFFPNTDLALLKAVVSEMIRELRLENPEWEYF